MTNGTKLIHGQVCARASELALIDRIPTSSHAVSGALLEARIDVDLLTLDEWKAILFGAFQAANDAFSPRAVFYAQAPKLQVALKTGAAYGNKTSSKKIAGRNRIWHRNTNQ